MTTSASWHKYWLSAVKADSSDDIVAIGGGTTTFRLFRPAEYEMTNSSPSVVAMRSALSRLKNVF